MLDEFSDKKGTFWLTLQNKLVFWKHLGKHFISKMSDTLIIRKTYLVCRNSFWNTNEAKWFFKGYYICPSDPCNMTTVILLWTKSNTNNSESSVALETTHNHIIVHTGLCHQVTEWANEFRSKVLSQSFELYSKNCFLTITGCTEYRNSAVCNVIF